MLLTVFSADSRVARVQTEMLSDQTLCELLIGSLDEDTQRRHQDSVGAFLDFEDFESVRLTENGYPDDIYLVNNDFHAKNYSGSLVTRYIPHSVSKVHVFNTKIDGTVDFSTFPLKLRTLALKSNLFSGSALLEALPESVKDVDISSNRFTGTIAFENLPPRLEELNVMNNGFQGTVRFRNLPRALRSLDVSINRFTGDLDFNEIPNELDRLRIFNNDFSGTLDRRSLRIGLTVDTLHPTWVNYPDNPLVDKRIYCNRNLEILRKVE